MAGRGDEEVCFPIFVDFMFLNLCSQSPGDWFERKGWTTTGARWCGE